MSGPDYGDGLDWFDKGTLLEDLNDRSIEETEAQALADLRAYEEMWGDSSAI